MDKRLIKRWIKALRSGKYEQGMGRLYAEGRFCCLGVLCEIQGVTAREMLGYRIPQGLPHGLVTQSTRMVDRDFENISGHALTTFNDNLDYTFTEIAEILEAVYIDERLA